MKVQEFMQDAPVCCSPETPINEVARMMNQGDFGAVIVTEDDELKGMITDRDIVTRCIAHDQKPDEICAQDIMSEEVVCCHAQDSLESACELMGQEQVRRLPVLDEQDHLMGVISLGDAALCEKNVEDGPVFNALEEISHH